MKIGSAEWKQLIIDGAKRFEIYMAPAVTEQFAVYAAELMKWNCKINLTSITGAQDVAIKHFLDSLMPSRLIKPDARMLDIGSGGGFPGIPLKILKPSLAVTLIDASRKKISFINHIVRTLELENIQARHLRAEEYAAQKDAVNGFDVVISRALTSLKNFVSMATPFLEKDGSIIAMKGINAFKELSAGGTMIDNQSNISINHVKYIVKIKKYTLPFQKSERSIIVFRRSL